MNGNISREGITADLEAMADIGLGGANIFNVSCDIPEGTVDYLSPEWLDLVRHAATEAKRLNLELGLKNCAGWATTGGPWIKPTESMQAIFWNEVEVTGGKLVKTKIPAPNVGHNNDKGHDFADLQSSYRDIALLAFPAGVDWQINRWSQKSMILGTTRAGMQPSLPKQGANEKSDQPVVDPDTILDITDKLAADGSLEWQAPAGEWTIVRLGHGSTGMVNHPAPISGTGLEADKLSRRGIDAHWKHGIQPILDHLGPLAGKTLTNLVIDSYEANFHSWTPDMRAEFKRLRGYEIGPYLVALTGRPVGSVARTERFYDDYRRTIGDLVAENYYGYMAELCHKHGLKIAIEPYRGPFESMAVAMQADIPTGEFFYDLGYGVPYLKLGVSAANLRGLPISAAESYTGVDGWRNHPGNLKYASDLAWTEGINRLVFHRYAHQPWPDLVPGMTMGPYGIHFDRTNTWWKPGKAWIASLTRCQFLLQRGTTAADVLCFAGEAVPNTSPNLNDLKRAGYDYDFCGTDILHQLTVKDGHVVVPSGRTYRALLMGPTGQPYLSLRAAEKLRELVAAGATVIGQKPTHTPSLTGFPEAETELLRLADEVWEPKGKALGFQKSDYLTAIGKTDMTPDVILPEGSDKLHWIHRQSETEDIWFISNQSRRAQQATLGFRVTGKLPELWDGVDGSIQPAAGWHVQGDHTYVPLSFQADGSAIVVFRKPGEAPTDPVIAVTSEPKDESAKLIVHRANLIWTGREKGNEEISARLNEAMTEDGLVGRVLDVTAAKSSPFWKHSLDIDYEWQGVRTRSIFRFHDHVSVPERHLLESSWQTQLVAGKNGAPTLRAWRPGDYVLTRASGKSETESVGEIRKPVTIDGPWQVDLNPMGGPPTTTKLKNLAGWNGTDFSGTAAFTITFDLDALPAADEEAWLDLGDVHVMAEVTLNGESLGTLWAPPFRVEVGPKLRAGKNELTVSVTNLWINRLIADAAQKDDIRWLESGAHAEWPEWIADGKLPEDSQRISFSAWKHWKADDIPPPAGLRGPVVLRFASLVELSN